MKKGLTEMVFILDKSGSMMGLAQDTIGGFNGMIEKQRALEGEALVTTVLFNQNSVTLHDRVPLCEVPPLTSREYSAGGLTALLDAVGDAMEHIRILHDYAGEAGRPEHTIFIITTDGQENSSRRYSTKQIKSMVSAARQERKWEFLFLGADIDAFEGAESLGIAPERAARFHHDSKGYRASYESMEHALCMMRTTGSVSSGWARPIEEDNTSRKK
ncbi:MAG: VWA domain-containing protein [Clostridia bacterium]|nr:VWA domain-containing protein [Clostridia bacterium]